MIERLILAIAVIMMIMGCALSEKKVTISQDVYDEMFWSIGLRNDVESFVRAGLFPPRTGVLIKKEI